MLDQFFAIDKCHNIHLYEPFQAELLNMQTVPLISMYLFQNKTPTYSSLLKYEAYKMALVCFFGYNPYEADQLL